MKEKILITFLLETISLADIGYFDIDSEIFEETEKSIKGYKEFEEFPVWIFVMY